MLITRNKKCIKKLFSDITCLQTFNLNASTPTTASKFIGEETIHMEEKCSEKNIQAVFPNYMEKMEKCRNQILCKLEIQKLQFMQ